MPNGIENNGLDPTSRLSVYVFVAILLAWGLHEAWTASIRKVQVEQEQTEIMLQMERRITALENLNDTLNTQLDRIERTVNLLATMRRESELWQNQKTLPTPKQ